TWPDELRRSLRQRAGCSDDADHDASVRSCRSEQADSRTGLSIRRRHLEHPDAHLRTLHGRADRRRCLLDEMGVLELAAHPHPVRPRWALRPGLPAVHLARELMEAVVNADCGPGRNYETYVRGGQS